MALVATLLELPKTSKGFTSFGISVLEQPNDGSASPRRKIARLDTDSDIGSRSASATGQVPPSGPFVIKIIGEDEPAKNPRRSERAQALIDNIGQFIKTTLVDPPGTDVKKSIFVTNEKVYSTCRTIVTVHDAGAELYSAVETQLERALIMLEKHVTAHDAGGERKWIGFFVKCCSWFEAKITLLQSLLTYLDRAYVAKHSTTVTSIKETAYSLFAKRVFTRKVHELIESSISTWLQFERENENAAVERPDVAELVSHLIAHRQYHTMFEAHYIEATHNFYQEESQAIGESLKDDPKALFDRIESRIKQEVERTRLLLPVGSWTSALETTEGALVGPHAKSLAASLVPLLLKSRDIETLGRMYSRYARVKELKTLQQAFRDHLQSEVKSIVTERDSDDEMVERLLALKKLADEAAEKAFVTSVPTPSDSGPSTSAAASETKADKDFGYALSDAFTQGFRSRRKKPAEMLARHLDKQLRKGQKDMKDAEYKVELCRVLPLYRYTEDRDVFRAFYQRMLARRLLLSKAASDDIEKWMLEELKTRYDPEFGEGPQMFLDMNLSQEEMRKFHEKEEDSTNFNAMVLKESAWPFSRSKVTVNLPHQMQEQITKFQDYYYASGKEGRLLYWDPRPRFNEGPKELSVSLYQTLVLLQFNEFDEIPFKDIAEQTNIEDAELRRTLQSLACGKKKVLKKVPPGRDVNDGDVFTFNADFSDPHHRVHINSIQEKVSAEETKRTEISIETDRVHTLEAAIVRLMKGRKEMSYQQLSMASVEAVKNHFNPDRDLIKKTIDSLVEREYMERSEEDRNKFKYVA
ncbi:Cullin-4B [Coprinopsis sp. MPI-PUGE-AT-0042]|nr:Cullin-4B [Coprinopsis sp. MPI-PUGE-AT-0042]